MNKLIYLWPLVKKLMNVQPRVVHEIKDESKEDEKNSTRSVLVKSSSWVFKMMNIPHF